MMSRRSEGRAPGLQWCATSEKNRMFVDCMDGLGGMPACVMMYCFHTCAGPCFGNYVGLVTACIYIPSLMHVQSKYI